MSKDIEKVRIFICWSRPSRPEKMHRRIMFLERELKRRVVPKLDRARLDILFDLKHKGTSWVRDLRAYAESCDIGIILYSQNMVDKVTELAPREEEELKGWVLPNELIPLQERFRKDDGDPNRVELLCTPVQENLKADSIFRHSEPIFDLFTDDGMGAGGSRHRGTPNLHTKPFPVVGQKALDSDEYPVKLEKWIDEFSDRVREVADGVVSRRRRRRRTLPSEVRTRVEDPLPELVVEAMWSAGGGKECRPIIGPTALEDLRSVARMQHDPSLFHGILEDLSSYEEELAPVLKVAEQGGTGYRLNPDLFEVQEMIVEPPPGPTNGDGNDDENQEDSASGQPETRTQGMRESDASQDQRPERAGKMTKEDRLEHLRQWISQASDRESGFTAASAAEAIGVKNPLPLQSFVELESEGLIQRIPPTEEDLRKRGRTPARFRFQSDPLPVPHDAGPAFETFESLVEECESDSQRGVVHALSEIANQTREVWVGGVAGIAEKAGLEYLATSRTLGELTALEPPVVVARGKTRSRKFKLNLVETEQGCEEIEPVDEAAREVADPAGGDEIDPLLEKLEAACETQSEGELVGIIWDQTLGASPPSDAIHHSHLRDLAESRMSQRDFYTALDSLINEDPARVRVVNRSATKLYVLVTD